MEGIRTSPDRGTGNEGDTLNEEQLMRLEAIERRLDEYYDEQDERFDTWRQHNGFEHN